MLLLLLMMVIYTSLSAQRSLKGKVTTSDTHKPVALANVYLSNTAVGTITGENGEFVIESFPEGRFDLVVSFIGYETFTTTVQSAKLPSFLEIVIKPKVDVLQEVIVSPYEKNGWEKWGRTFTDYFIGTSANAADCKLLNAEVLKFRHNKKTNTLSAFADETLVIENNALGYRLKYDLTKFEYHFSTGLLYYQGYPFFEDMEAKSKRLNRKWHARRDDCYYGSVMHFMRSFYRNTLSQEHFEVRRLIRISAAEKKRVRGIFQEQVAKNSMGRIIMLDADAFGPDVHKDSVNYYLKVMRQPEKLNVLIDQKLPGDSIGFGVDSTTAGLYFTDYLQVIYTAKKIPNEYALFSRQPPGIPLRSELTLPADKEVHVLANGLYYEGFDLLTLGYWAWSEKIANMLPYEYKPLKKE